MAAITNTNEAAHEIIPRIWLGNRNAALNQDGWLAKHDIESVFNATKDIPFADDTQTIKYRIPVDDNLEDGEIANMAKWSPEIIYNVLHEYQAGRTILVHCAAGMQRSAAIVAMTLIALYGMTTDEAITFIKNRRKIAFYPGANFYKSIQAFEQYFKHVLKPQLYAVATATAAPSRTP
jgi:rhodanese-related sulfurtransferase